MSTADPIVVNHVGLDAGTDGSDVTEVGLYRGNDVGVDVDNNVGLDTATDGTDVGLAVGNDIEFDVGSYGSLVSSDNLQVLNAGFDFSTQVISFV